MFGVGAGVVPAGAKPGYDFASLGPDLLVGLVRHDDGAESGRVGGLGDGGVVLEMVALIVLQRLIDDEQA
jgi:hypothetical protein